LKRAKARVAQTNICAYTIQARFKAWQFYNFKTLKNKNIYKK